MLQKGKNQIRAKGQKNMKEMKYLIWGLVIVMGVFSTAFAERHDGYYGRHGKHKYHHAHGYHSGYKYSNAFHYRDRISIQKNLRAIRRNQYMVNFANERQAGILRDDIERRVHYLRYNFGVEVP